MAKIENGILVLIEDEDVKNGEFKIFNNIETIDVCAFGYCHALEKIRIPNSVKLIYDFAFEGCDALKEIKIPNSIIEIGIGILWNCESLEKVIIPNHLQLTSNWFNENTNLNCIVHHQGKKYTVEDILTYY